MYPSGNIVDASTLQRGCEIMQAWLEDRYFETSEMHPRFIKPEAPEVRDLVARILQCASMTSP